MTVYKRDQRSTNLMTDILTRKMRSALMSRIRGVDTKPELFVRRALHAKGYRFRTHFQELPGRPDLVFTKRQAVIFVHGCFWHGHAHCRRAKLPSTNRNFWATKIQKNKFRDSLVRGKLTRLGWESLVLWQCQASKSQNRCALQKKIKRFLLS